MSACASSSARISPSASSWSCSASVPSAAKAFSTSATGSSRSITRAPAAASALRSSACAHTAPNIPVLAPMTAAGLLRRAAVANGREAQSTAFFSAPGIEELYSGVTNSRASALPISVRQRPTSDPGLRSSSSSNGGIAFRPVNATNSASGGSSAAAVRSRRPLCESLRSEPVMPRTRMAVLLAVLRKLELDRQLDVVGQSEAALGQRRVPLQAELRAVDDGLQREADLDRAAERLVRVGDRATGLDGVGVVLDRQLAVDHELLAVAADRL